MNRAFVAFNFVGILVLCALCSAQWKLNSEINHRADTLEVLRQQHVAKLVENEQTIRNYKSDIEDFRQRLSLCEAQLEDLNNKLTRDTAERASLTAERNHLKIALGKWMLAVADRDKTINEARSQLQAFATDRNDAVQRGNVLTDKYNALVKQWNELQAKR